MDVKNSKSDLGVQRYFTGLSCFVALLLYALKARGEDKTTWTACGFHLLIETAFCVILILSFIQIVEMREELDKRKVSYATIGKTLPRSVGVLDRYSSHSSFREMQRLLFSAR
jgi:hypothetical protein